MQRPLNDRTAPGTTTDVPAPTLAQRAGALLDDLRELACDHLELAVLETQRAATGLARMLCAAVVVSILLVSAWLALVAGGIVWATASGVSWGMALVVAAGINLVLAAGLAFWISRQTQEMLFSATLRQLRRNAAVPEVAA